MSESSRTVDALLSELDRLGVRIRAEGDRLRLNSPVGAINDALRAEMAARKPELIAYFQDNPSPESTPAPALCPAPRDRPLPLSAAQKRLWLSERQSQPSGAYNVPIYLRLRGICDATALQKSLTILAERHETLRTLWQEREGQPVQVILPAAAVALPMEDWQHLTEPLACNGTRNLPDEVWARARRETERPFDLAREVLWRSLLLRLGARDHLLLVTFHHGAVDGRSLQIFEGELAACYRAATAGKPPQLPPLPWQYGDYALWQQGRSEALAPQLEYWRDRLADLPPLQLPLDRPRPESATPTNGRHQGFEVPAGVARALERLTRAAGATLYMTLLAALQLLLQRYSGQDRIAVGSPVANRTHPELKGVIGFFVNLLVLDGDLSGNPTFQELLQRTKDRSLAAYDRQEVPFEKIVAALAPQRAANPFFQVAFALQPPLSMLEAFALGPELQAELLLERASTVRLDIELHVWKAGDGGLQGHCFYNADLFAGETITAMMAAYTCLLGEIAADPTRPIDDYDPLDATARAQLLAWGQGARRPYPRDTGLAQLFARRVATAPEATALVEGDRRLSYGDLDARASRLAQFLQTKGVARGSIVGFCLERSIEAIVAILAILKAGGAYLPLDPHHPPERLHLTIADARPQLVLTLGRWLERLPSETDVEIVPLDVVAETVARQPATNPEIASHGEDLAYILYTSGSTGRPKGVCVPQRAVARLFENADYMAFGAREIWLHSAPLTFDASAFEIWGSLLGGAALVVLPGPTDPTVIGRAIAQYEVTTLVLMAGLLHFVVDEFLESLQSVRQLVSGGEALSAAHACRVLQRFPHCRIINGYGPTENTAISTAYTLIAAEVADTVPIGKPIANSQAYVLNDRQQLVPVGVAGELYVGGDGVAVGYLNRPELTRERFITNPFGPGRLYKTGDWARWRSDGNLEYLGRRDSQVKVRGFRIELGEIEACLRAHPTVRNAAVTVWQERLAAYIVPIDEKHAKNIDAWLDRARSRLPAHLVPASITVMAALPLTANGKCDRRALPAPSVSGEPVASEEPLSPQEREIATLFAKLLGVERVGRHDDFFELGGHSLLAARLATRLQATLGKAVPLQKIFELPTVARLAAWSARATEAALPPCLLPLKLEGTGLPLFFLPPAGGSSLCYRDTARAIARRPVYGFQMPGLQPGEASHRSVEAAAADFMGALRAVQPHGPYYLAGWSYGGLLAFELARQLDRAGETVALLGIIDRPLLPDGAWHERWQLGWRVTVQITTALGRLATSYAGLQQLARGTGISLPQTFTDIRQRSRREQFLFWQNLASEAYRSLRVFATNTLAGMRYQPQTYSGRVAVFCARATARASGKASRAGREFEGWRAVAGGGITLRELPGNHMTLVLDPEGARGLARAIEAAATDCV